MEINFDLIKFIAIAGIGASVISTPVIQKIKEMLKTKKYLNIIACLVSILIGEFFTLSFTNFGAVNGLWVGIITWAGASAIYKTFENKLFTPFGELDNSNDIVIDRGDKDV